MLADRARREDAGQRERRRRQPERDHWFTGFTVKVAVARRQSGSQGSGLSKSSPPDTVAVPPSPANSTLRTGWKPP